MLWTLFGILLILWLLGLGFHIAGVLIHLLLVIAILMLIINIVRGYRTEGFESGDALLNLKTRGVLMQDTVLLCMGYTCLCGEKVTVFRIPTSTPAGDRISRKTVTCKNGHVRTVTVDQLRMLDYWIEETEDEQELATGT